MKSVQKEQKIVYLPFIKKTTSNKTTKALTIYILENNKNKINIGNSMISSSNTT